MPQPGAHGKSMPSCTAKHNNTKCTGSALNSSRDPTATTATTATTTTLPASPASPTPTTGLANVNHTLAASVAVNSLGASGSVSGPGSKQLGPLPLALPLPLPGALTLPQLLPDTLGTDSGTQASDQLWLDSSIGVGSAQDEGSEDNNSSSGSGIAPGSGSSSSPFIAPALATLQETRPSPTQLASSSPAPRRVAPSPQRTAATTTVAKAAGTMGGSQLPSQVINTGDVSVNVNVNVNVAGAVPAVAPTQGICNCRCGGARVAGLTTPRAGGLLGGWLGGSRTSAAANSLTDSIGSAVGSAAASAVTSALGQALTGLVAPGGLFRAATDVPEASPAQNADSVSPGIVSLSASGRQDLPGSLVYEQQQLWPARAPPLAAAPLLAAASGHGSPATPPAYPARAKQPSTNGRPAASSGSTPSPSTRAGRKNGLAGNVSTPAVAQQQQSTNIAAPATRFSALSSRLSNWRQQIAGRALLQQTENMAATSARGAPKPQPVNVNVNPVVTPGLPAASATAASGKASGLLPCVCQVCG
ncbi:hypothetical protein QJQ45_000012 [Haematococcus lacustris]|nr:hypothetical protein QJQ45_000012 [Haematococcus lacustris]